jgi:hypothetical protein
MGALRRAFATAFFCTAAAATAADAPAPGSVEAILAAEQRLVCGDAIEAVHAQLGAPVRQTPITWHEYVIGGRRVLVWINASLASVPNIFEPSSCRKIRDLPESRLSPSEFEARMGAPVASHPGALLRFRRGTGVPHSLRQADARVLLMRDRVVRVHSGWVMPE